MTTATNTAAGVRELIVPATMDALNAALTENQIRPDKIISVMLQPRRELAIGDFDAKYHVLYRV
ncbi:MAG: hypothetical protein GEU91_11260 [Rhizobiales bacterium]|nr:hypothetical protein [Hyphomicrobiales bacterium]